MDDGDAGRKGKKGHGDGPPGGGRHAGAELIRGVLAGEVPLAVQTHRESDIRQAVAPAEDFGLRVIVVGGAQAWRAAAALGKATVAVERDQRVNLPSTSTG